MVVSRVNFKHKLMHVNHLMQNHIVIVYMTRIDLEGIIRFIKASHIRRCHLSDAVTEAVIAKITESNRQNYGRSDLVSVVIRYFTLQERICNRPRRKQHIFKKSLNCITFSHNLQSRSVILVCLRRRSSSKKYSARSCLFRNLVPRGNLLIRIFLFYTIVFNEKTDQI